MMKALNTMKVAFPSRSANEGFARSVVAAFAAQADPTMDELADIRTAHVYHRRARTRGPWLCRDGKLYGPCESALCAREGYAGYAGKEAGPALST